MQRVIWVVQFRDGSQVREFDENGKETVFSGDFLLRKPEFEHIGLIDTGNNLSYSINLATGEFVISGQAFSPSKEMDGRVFPITRLEGVDYRSGVIQYKVSNPVNFGSSAPITPASFNIGYKVKLPEKFLPHKRSGGVSFYDNAQATLSINAESLQPSVAVTFTMKTVYDNGVEEMVKI